MKRPLRKKKFRPYRRQKFKLQTVTITMNLHCSKPSTNHRPPRSRICEYSNRADNETQYNTIQYSLFNEGDVITQ